MPHSASHDPGKLNAVPSGPPESNAPAGGVEGLSEIFSQAMELPESARDEFIEQASGGDVGFRIRVHQLLAAHRSRSRFLRNPSVDPFAALLRETEQIGEWIGPYRLINSYHCSRLNTNTGRLTPAMFQAIFARARDLLDG